MMIANDKTIESCLLEAQEIARNEYAGMQILGRALTVDELERSDKLSNCLEHIQEALDALKKE